MIIKLGLQGLEQDLPQESLIIESVVISDDNRKSKSANGSLHIDFLPSKRKFSFSWLVVLETTFELLSSIEELQRTNLTNLSLILDTKNIYSIYASSITWTNLKR